MQKFQIGLVFTPGLIFWATAYRCRCEWGKTVREKIAADSVA